jgi:uncharacterized protein YggE
MNRSVLIVTILALCGSLVAATPALAQGDAGIRAGITTTGYGEASTPAESARMEFLIISQDAFYGGPPQAPEVEATPGAMARETVAPIADAIEASGAAESVEVVIPLTTDFYSQAPLARIDITVPNPDLDGLTSLVNDVTQAAAGERLLVGYVGAQFETSDCATLERNAREAALADARSRADIQADLLGVSLGEVVAVADLDTSGVAALQYGVPVASASNCDAVAAGSSVGQFSPGASLPRFDPTSDSGEVEVYRQLQVTFAIDASEATPVS